MSELEAMALPGYDRDVVLAILSQARLRTNPIDDIQVRHLLAIGYRAGVAAAERRGWDQAIAALRDRQAFMRWSLAGLNLRRKDYNTGQIAADYLTAVRDIPDGA